MEKTRFRYITSLILVMIFLIAPLRVLRAADDVTVKAIRRNGGNSYDIFVTNSSGREITSWVINIYLPDGATFDGSWNCGEDKISNNHIRLTNQSEWQLVPPGQTIEVAGFNLSGEYEEKNLTVTIKPEFAAPPTPSPSPTPKPTKGATPTPTKPATPTPTKPVTPTPTKPVTPTPTKPVTPAPTKPVTPTPTKPATPTPTKPATPTPTKPVTPTPTKPVTPTPTKPADPTVVPGTVATVTPAPSETTVQPTPSDPSDSSETTESTQAPSETEDPGAGTHTPVDGDDWLTTDGNRIVDRNGTQVWLTGVNWFGYNTGTNIFDGCWNCNMADALKAIADHGFNLLRIPMSAELALQWKKGEYPQANFNQATNAELVGMNSQEIFDYALSLCREYGIKVMLDIHSANTDASGHMTNLWYTDKVSLQDYYDALSYLADRYKNDDTIIAFDLKNEPHGKPNEEKAIWNNSQQDNNWKYVAETAGNLVLDKNPNLLIVIEGIEIYPKDIASNGDFSSTNNDDYYFNWWGANLRGVKDYPIDFGSEERNRQIVYSPHDYGPTVYKQPWFEGDFTYESLQADCWNENWLYIYDENIAPLLIGEWGGFMTEPNLTWMTYLRQLIGEKNLNYTFWCFNSNSGDTGGLVLDDFTTWDEAKYAFVKEVLWQDDDKFVGLDHEVPLGANGIALSAYSGALSPSSPKNDPAPDDTTPADPSDTAPSEGAAAAMATAASAGKKSISVKKIIIYVLLILLLLLILVGLYLFIKLPKVWNRIIDHFYLPEKLKRDIPWEIEPEPSSRFQFSPDMYPQSKKNNEFAGKYRPTKKGEAASDSDKSAVASQAKSSSIRPSPRPIAKPAAGTNLRPSAKSASAGENPRPMARPAASASATAASASAATQTSDPEAKNDSSAGASSDESTPKSPFKRQGTGPARPSSSAARPVSSTRPMPRPAGIGTSATRPGNTSASMSRQTGAGATASRPADTGTPGILKDFGSSVPRSETEPIQPKENILPTWASGSAIPNGRPIWAKPNPDETKPEDTKKPEQENSGEE